MKAMLSFSFGLAVVLLPFAGGGDPTTTNSSLSVAPAQVSAGDSADNLVATNEGLIGPDIPASSAGSVPTAAPAPPSVPLTPPVADVAKLAQAGVDESVMLSFVTNSPNTFNLTSDAIVYLNDLGVPSEVVNAMIQHDQTLRANVPLVTAPPAYAGAAYPADTGSTDTTASTQTETTYVENPPDLTDTSEAAAEPNVSYTYFYNSLAPYGAWITVGGYGPCWRPTACVVTPGWQPYCNSGHWVYTDCGWYWASSYSWGWAPFHYGRWFYAPSYGWCWSPGRVWAPAWVSWRYTSDHCGWAPLPPSAYYRPGVGFSYYGRSVGFSFNFGLQPSSFVFVPTSRFCDPHPSQYRVAGVGAGAIYNRSVPYNRFGEGQNHVVINRGIPVDRISAVTHTTIQPVTLHDVPAPPGPRPGTPSGHGNTLAVFRPVPTSPAHGGAFPVQNNPAIPATHPGGTVTTTSPGFGARTQNPVPIYHNQAPVNPTAPAHTWIPQQGNPTVGAGTAPSQFRGTPSPTVPAPHPQNSWSLPRRGEGGNQLVAPSQNRSYPAPPPANSAPPQNWGNNNSMPAHPSPVPPAPQHNNTYVAPPPPHNSQPQQPQQPQQFNGPRH